MSQQNQVTYKIEDTAELYRRPGQIRVEFVLEDEEFDPWEHVQTLPWLQ